MNEPREKGPDPVQKIPAGRREAQIRGDDDQDAEALGMSSSSTLGLLYIRLCELFRTRPLSACGGLPEAYTSGDLSFGIPSSRPCRGGRAPGAVSMSVCKKRERESRSISIAYLPCSPV